MARTMRFCHFLQKRYQRMDGRTDGRTRPHITVTTKKMILEFTLIYGY